MSSPFEEIVELKVKLQDAQLRKAAHDIETLKSKASGIPLTLDVKQESFRRAAAQLEAATKLRTATVRVEVDDRGLNSSLTSLRNKLGNTRFIAELDKSQFENKIRELELKRDALDVKFRDGFKAKLDADNALLSLGKLRQEADSVHEKLNRQHNISVDSSQVAGFNDHLKQSLVTMSSVRSVVTSLPAPLVAAGAGFAAVAVSASATAAAIGLTAVGIGSIAAASLSSTTRMKEAFGNASAEIQYKFTEMSSVILPNFERIAQGARDTFSNISPALQKMVADTGPLLETMFGGVATAIQAIMPSISNLVAESGPMVDSLSQAMVTLADSIAVVLDKMAATSGGAGQGIELLASGLGHVIEQFGTLIQLSNVVTGAIGAVKDTVGLLTSALPGGAEAMDTFTDSISMAANPLGALLDGMVKLNDVINRNAPKPITVEVKGKAVPDPNFRPEDLFKVPPGGFLPGMVTSIQNDVRQAQSILKQGLQAMQSMTIGGRFKLAMDTTDAQQAMSQVTSLRSAWVSAQNEMSSASRNFASVQQQNSRAVADAQRGIVSAEKAVQEAQARSAVAQQELGTARIEAARDIDQLRSKLRDLGDHEEEARIRLGKAQVAVQQLQLTSQQATRNFAMEEEAASIALARAQLNAQDAFNSIQTSVRNLSLEKEGASIRLARANAAQADLYNGIQQSVRNLGLEEEAAALRLARATLNAQDTFSGFANQVRDLGFAEEAASLRLSRAKIAIEEFLGYQAKLKDLGSSEEAARIRLERAQLAARQASLAPGQTFTDAEQKAREATEANLRQRESALQLKAAEAELARVVEERRVTEGLQQNEAREADIEHRELLLNLAQAEAELRDVQAQRGSISQEQNRIMVEASLRQRENALAVRLAEEELVKVMRERANEGYVRAQEAIDLDLRKREAVLNIKQAEEALAGFQEQERLIEAGRSREAIENDLRKREATLGVAQAEASLAKVLAEKDLQVRMAQIAAISLDLSKREALLELKNAEEGMYDVIASNQVTRDQVAEAERRGIENHPLVLAAKQQLTAAIENENTAKDNLSQANQRLSDVTAENTQRTYDAMLAMQEARNRTDISREAYEKLLHILGLTDAQVVAYNQHLKELPAKVDQFIKLHGLEDVLKGAARLGMEIDAQKLMAEHPDWTPEQALQHASARYVGRDIVGKVQAFESKMRETLGSIPFLGGKRDGGPISGPGDSRSDSVMIAAASGEFMQPADAVQHYGSGFMEAVRKKQFPKFADGGPVNMAYDWNVNAAKWPMFDMLRKSGIVDRARNNAASFFAPKFSGGLGSSSEHSYGALHQLAKKFDPGAIMTSDYRRGDPGNHGKGLAADFAGNMGAIARGFYGVKESLMQLIHSGSGGFFVAGGQTVSGNGYYGAQTVAEHHDHVHVAARKDAIDAILNPGAAGASGGSGVERWRGVVNQALGIVGQPVSLANTTLRRMNQESGGDPNIVNKWDSNWTAGHPSVGLMQVIRGTYAAYKHPGHDRGPYSYDVSVDPLSNIVASMRYTLSRYGSLPAGYDRPGGYRDGGMVFDEGGMLPLGPSIVNNKTGRPEPLLNADKSLNLSSDTITQLARVLAQALRNRPATLMLPDGRVLAETVGESLIGEATVPGVSF